MENENLFYVHSLDFEVLLSLISKCTLVNRCTVYTMANKATDYAANDKIKDLIYLLNEYNANEQWRMSVKKNINLTINDNGIILNELGTIKDIVQCVAIPSMNMILIIPGEQSSDFNAANIIQLNNLFMLQPMMLQMESVQQNEGDDKRDLGASFVIYSPQEEQTSD